MPSNLSHNLLPNLIISSSSSTESISDWPCSFLASYAAADYVISIESIPHPNVTTARHTIATKKRERGKKGKTLLGTWRDNNICISVFYLASPHTHERGFLMLERLRKYGQVFARMGSQLEMTRDTWRRPKVSQVLTQRGQEVWMLSHHAERGEGEKSFTRETAEREDSGVCLFISLVSFPFFYQGTTEHPWTLKASSHL